MKRYDFRVKNGVPGLYAVEDGDYYFVPDVESTMIPRPDAGAARKAVDDLIDLAYEHCTALIWKEQGKASGLAEEIKIHKAAVLALMGVE